MMSSNENQTKGSDCRVINITFAIINENSRRWLNPHVETFQSFYPHIKVNLGELVGSIYSNICLIFPYCI